MGYNLMLTPFMQEISLLMIIKRLHTTCFFGETIKTIQVSYPKMYHLSKERNTLQIFFRCRTTKVIRVHRTNSMIQ